MVWACTLVLREGSWSSSLLAALPEVALPLGCYRTVKLLPCGCEEAPRRQLTD